VTSPSLPPDRPAPDRPSPDRQLPDRPAPDQPSPDRQLPDRPALDAAALRAAVIRPGGLWRAVDVTAVTGSTNADLLARAADSEPEGAVLAAEQQDAGRGRMGRSWVAPPRAALTFSMLLRPRDVPPARRGWLSLLAGVAAASSVRAVAGVDATLKWPNDVLVRGAKLGGILAEAAGQAVVVGIGLNVSTGPDELPPPGPGALAATSLRLSGSDRLDREALLADLLAGFERRYRAWCQVLGDAERSGLHAEYTRLSATLGRRVRVERPGGQHLTGLATGVDPDGRLLVREPPAAELAVAAGDVVHLR
jgi:BirA family transcriptional regulator, biotin operon repressor / biotin---[acetyl-CoA-carboxylase] ligase